MINFGIDLGTTNSLISRFDKGVVEVFKNPSGFKETLPSIVGFRADRIIVGEQAKAYAEKDPKSVCSRFKRKMGTAESLKIKALNASKTPVELSALVLKELRTFIRSGENPEAAVITIPASFDTVQSIATKEAGHLAGFKQVVLLQEPIAASLAYANRAGMGELKNSQWIVYDLGGGTFDVALVRIVEGELTVVDHEGDNYLGGSDFDALVVEKIIAPELLKRGRFTDLLQNLKSDSGRYNRLWSVLLHKAEEAKIELSNRASTEIDLSMVRDLIDEDGKEIDSIIAITRSELESVLKDAIDSTAEMMRKILTRNSLQPKDLKFVLMVGGATYTPFVRKRIEELMEIPVNTNIDPTNAIVVGAAYFASSKEVNLEQKTIVDSGASSSLRIKVAFNRVSQEREELFSAKIEGQTSGLMYRITREDGGYDSGTKRLAPRIVEELPLQENAFNIFSLKIYNEQNQLVASDVGRIQIAQGKFSVAGQMLPDDICLVKDDHSKRGARLELVFARNAILPTKCRKTVEVGRTVVKGSEDEIRIMIVEGSSDNHFSTNKNIGVLLIAGKQVSRDLMRGTEIDLNFEISESREISVSAYLNGTGQEFAAVFSPKPRAVPTRTLSREIEILEAQINDEKGEAESDNGFEVAEKLKKLEDKIQELVGEAALLSIDDVTDDRFKLEDKKRKLAQEFYQATSGKALARARSEYIKLKGETASLVNESGNDRERRQFGEIVAREYSFIDSKVPEKIEAHITVLTQIRWAILLRKPDILVGMFNHLVEKRASLNDQIQAKNLIENGRRHVTEEAWDDLRQVNIRLWELMPSTEKESESMRPFTGII